MKRLQEETLTKMAVLGRGSMRDKQKVSTEIYSPEILPCVGCRRWGRCMHVRQQYRSGRESGNGSVKSEMYEMYVATVIKSNIMTRH